MPTDRQALAALDDIDRILSERIGRPLTVEKRASGIDDLSAEYWEIRMRLDTGLTLVNKIPVYGRRIATAVRFLMQICDRHCSPAHDGSGTQSGSINEARIASGHDPSRPRSLGRDPVDFIQPGSSGARDRGLMGTM